MALEQPWRRVWPPHVKASFDLTESVPEVFRRRAAEAPSRVALVYGAAEVTYGELDGLCDRFAQALLGLGLAQGDRVALFLQNCPQFVVAYLGTLRAGGVVVPLNPMFKHAEIDEELRDSGARVLVASELLYPEAQKVRDGCSSLEHVVIASEGDFGVPSGALPFPRTLAFRALVDGADPVPTNRVTHLERDLALLQYTGGTTGLPKGAMISHHALASAVAAANNWFAHSDDDVYLGAAPYFHIMGMVMGLCGPLTAGGRLVVLPRFTPEGVARAIHEHKVTAWNAAATMVVALLQFPSLGAFDLSSLRYVCCGGAPFSPELQKKTVELAPRAHILEGYGLTECVAHGAVATPLGGYRPGFVGVPHVNEVAIVDTETGERFLPPNGEGEIVVRGPALFQGYWNRPEETATQLRNGWLHTGDLGLLDDDGYLKVLGRNRELIKCSAFSVFPADVEDLLYRHPAVGEVAVIGVPDPYRGQSPKAFVVLRPEFEGKLTEGELVAWAKENMAAYKCPREVEFRAVLPKSGAGKLLRRLLEEPPKGAV